MLHIYTTHKFTKKFMLYFMYIRVKNYEADMKLNVFRWTNILLQYSMVKMIVLVYIFVPHPPATIALNVT